MIYYTKITLGILLVLGASRFIPHPPNFTSLIALSFYIPAFLGIRYLPALILSFVVTDLFIGLHGLTFFTWGSAFLIGMLSKYFISSLYYRMGGALIGACIFFFNYKLWSLVRWNLWTYIRRFYIMLFIGNSFFCSYSYFNFYFL